MTTERLKELGFEPVVDAGERQVSGGFCGDLLSWAMGRCGEGQVWFTVMGNVNAVAVASLADAAAIVLCDGAALMADAEARARGQGVNVYRTALPEFEAAAGFAKVLA